MPGPRGVPGPRGGSAPGGVPGPGGMPGPGGCLLPGGFCLVPGGCLVWGVCLVETHPGQLLLRAVCILLECILVNIVFGPGHLNFIQAIRGEC